MKTYILKVNVHEKKKFFCADWHTVGSVEAKSITAAQEKVKAASYGHPSGDVVNFTVDIKRYSGHTIKAFTE
jgi:hypothetical protein